MTPQQLATTLAALRFFQANPATAAKQCSAHFEEFDPLDEQGIDALCEQLQYGTFDHEGCECAACGKDIENEDDGTSSPIGSMHKECVEAHEAEHPDQW